MLLLQRIVYIVSLVLIMTADTFGSPVAQTEDESSTASYETLALSEQPLQPFLHTLTSLTRLFQARAFKRSFIWETWLPCAVIRCELSTSSISEGVHVSNNLSSDFIRYRISSAHLSLLFAMFRL